MIRNTMNICAIIINYFGYENTIPCVRSLMPQGISKIVVLDNSAEENQAKALLEAFQGLAQIDVIASKNNMGFAGGVNFVLREMLQRQFDAYLLLNNDTLVPDGLVESLVTGIHHSSLDIAAPHIYGYPMKDILWSSGNYYNNITGLITPKPIPIIPRTYYYLTGCCLMVKREVFEKIGLFDESFFMYGEDIEFCHRAGKNGFHIGIEKNAKLYHHVNASSQNNSLFYEYHINRSHLILSKKLSQSRNEHMALFPIKLIMLGIRSLVRTMRYRNRNALIGYVAATIEKFNPDHVKTMIVGKP
jgi:N-acetylglucosaminyl-diphospho-decaprenol L-rhamnosyltransferase